MAADNTTGHVWDEDLRELNNPLPRWWMGLFVLTVVFSLGYLVLYPGLGSCAGTLGWTQRRPVRRRAAQRRSEAMAPLYAALRRHERRRSWPPTRRRWRIGERLFVNNCATCHGSDARGSKGFPNLTDGDWLYGGTPEKIAETITQGRQRRDAADGRGGRQRARTCATSRNYVLSLSGSPHDAIAAQLGQGQVRRLRGLPRRRRQGQPGARRAEPRPTRSGCTAGASRRSSTIDQQRQDQRDAGARRHA